MQSAYQALVGCPTGGNMRKFSKIGSKFFRTWGSCVDGNVADMTLILVKDSDYEKIRAIMNEVVAPRWAGRCGADCAAAW